MLLISPSVHDPYPAARPLFNLYLVVSIQLFLRWFATVRDGVSEAIHSPPD